MGRAFGNGLADAPEVGEAPGGGVFQARRPGEGPRVRARELSHGPRQARRELLAGGLLRLRRSATVPAFVRGVPAARPGERRGRGQLREVEGAGGCRRRRERRRLSARLGTNTSLWLSFSSAAPECTIGDEHSPVVELYPRRATGQGG